MQPAEKPDAAGRDGSSGQLYFFNLPHPLTKVFIMEDDFLAQAEDDLRTVEFIRAYLPQEVKERFTDDDLFYFIDLLAEYYVESGLVDQEPDEEGYVDIDTEAIAKAISERAAKDKYGKFSPEDLLWVVQGELEYGEQEG